MKKLILASQSPRRRGILEKAQIPFEVEVSHVSEETDQTKPAKIVEELAGRKAQAVFLFNPSDIVLGADTMVALGDQIFGKPKTKEEAYEMLTKLRNHVHQVYTGVAFAFADKNGMVKLITHVEKTDVYVGDITDVQIRDYIESGEPMDKAGAYAIQGPFGQFIKSIDGDYYNVVGLPLYYVSHMLKKIRDRDK
ncbi:MAG: septum formation inhibitor Maf [Lachnospiraceae bacterium]|nr:septum formation inhibitor Maf [Lachnospiraceae bacterium]